MTVLKVHQILVIEKECPQYDIVIEKDDKLSGKTEEDVNAFIGNYMEAALDYELSVIQKLRYFCKSFDEEAKSLYRYYI